jgi:hypothetical protein
MLIRPDDFFFTRYVEPERCTFHLLDEKAVHEQFQTIANINDIRVFCLSQGSQHKEQEHALANHGFSDLGGLTVGRWPEYGAVWQQPQA